MSDHIIKSAGRRFAISYLTITMHEYRMMFRSIYGWTALALVTAIGGYFFYLSSAQFLNIAQYNPEHNLGVVSFIGANVFTVFNQSLLFLTPILTASAISAEHRHHTMPLLQSSPVSSWVIVLGKFKGIQGYYNTFLLIALTMVMLLGMFNPLDYLHLACIYIGSIALLSTYVAIGVYCSTLSKNFFVSAVVCLILLLVFSFVLGALARDYPEIEWLVFTNHSRPFLQGEFDTRHLAFFLLMIMVFLFLARQRLESARRT